MRVLGKMDGVLLSILIFFIFNFYAIVHMISHKRWLLLFIPFFVITMISLHNANKKMMTMKLRKLNKGVRLLKIFLISSIASIIFLMVSILGKYMVVPGFHYIWMINTVIVFLLEGIVFWPGMIRVYLYSVQLGFKYRIIGAICGWIPILNLIVLLKIITIVEKEVQFENEKCRQNSKRKESQICKTKYPILLVHGVFFRDFKYFNYWGRIPKELEKNGATIYYGNHQSAASIEESAKELKRRIQEIIYQEKCEKVNVIAHSKGGLDCRYAISLLDCDQYVASLTTINTPHRGCEFADYLLSKIPLKVQKMVAKTYNATLKKLGDQNPDFLSAVNDLTASACEKFNEQVKDKTKVYYQSVGSKLNVATSGRFPLNFTYQLVKWFDGDNDGLVGEKSFKWGNDYQFITVEGKRGISHGDMIDLNRENFDGFDVRKFYVDLVAKLKEKQF